MTASPYRRRQQLRLIDNPTHPATQRLASFAKDLDRVKAIATLPGAEHAPTGIILLLASLNWRLDECARVLAAYANAD